MKRNVNIADNHKKAREYDISQQNKMTPYERHLAAKELKIRYYGKNTKDVRESGVFKIK